MINLDYRIFGEFICRRRVVNNAPIKREGDNIINKTYDRPTECGYKNIPAPKVYNYAVTTV